MFRSSLLPSFMFCFSIVVLLALALMPAAVLAATKTCKSGEDFVEDADIPNGGLSYEIEADAGCKSITFKDLTVAATGGIKFTSALQNVDVTIENIQCTSSNAEAVCIHLSADVSGGNIVVRNMRWTTMMQNAWIHPKMMHVAAGRNPVTFSPKTFLFTNAKWSLTVLSAATHVEPQLLSLAAIIKDVDSFVVRNVVFVCPKLINAQQTKFSSVDLFVVHRSVSSAAPVALHNVRSVVVENLQLIVQNVETTGMCRARAVYIYKKDTSGITVGTLSVKNVFVSVDTGEHAMNKDSIYTICVEVADADDTTKIATVEAENLAQSLVSKVAFGTPTMRSVTFRGQFSAERVTLKVNYLTQVAAEEQDYIWSGFVQSSAQPMLQLDARLDSSLAGFAAAKLAEAKVYLLSMRSIVNVSRLEVFGAPAPAPAALMSIKLQLDARKLTSPDAASLPLFAVARLASITSPDPAAPASATSAADDTSSLPRQFNFSQLHIAVHELESRHPITVTIVFFEKDSVAVDNALGLDIRDCSVSQPAEVAGAATTSLRHGGARWIFSILVSDFGSVVSLRVITIAAVAVRIADVQRVAIGDGTRDLKGIDSFSIALLKGRLGGGADAAGGGESNGRLSVVNSTILIQRVADFAGNVMVSVAAVGNIFEADLVVRGCDVSSTVTAAHEDKANDKNGVVLVTADGWNSSATVNVSDCSVTMHSTGSAATHAASSNSDYGHRPYAVVCALQTGGVRGDSTMAETFITMRRIKIFFRSQTSQRMEVFGFELTQSRSFIQDNGSPCANLQVCALEKRQESNTVYPWSPRQVQLGRMEILDVVFDIEGRDITSTSSSIGFFFDAQIVLAVLIVERCLVSNSVGWTNAGVALMGSVFSARVAHNTFLGHGGKDSTGSIISVRPPIEPYRNNWQGPGPVRTANCLASLVVLNNTMNVTAEIGVTFIIFSWGHDASPTNGGPPARAIAAGSVQSSNNNVVFRCSAIPDQKMILVAMFTFAWFALSSLSTSNDSVRLVASQYVAPTFVVRIAYFGQSSCDSLVLSSPVAEPAAPDFEGCSRVVSQPTAANAKTVLPAYRENVDVGGEEFVGAAFPPSVAFIAFVMGSPLADADAILGGNISGNCRYRRTPTRQLTPTASKIVYPDPTPTESHVATETPVVWPTNPPAAVFAGSGAAGSIVAAAVIPGVFSVASGVGSAAASSFSVPRGATSAALMMRRMQALSSMASSACPVVDPAALQPLDSADSNLFAFSVGGENDGPLATWRGAVLSPILLTLVFVAVMAGAVVVLFLYKKGTLQKEAAEAIERQQEQQQQSESRSSRRNHSSSSSSSSSAAAAAAAGRAMARRVADLKAQLKTLFSDVTCAAHFPGTVGPMLLIVSPSCAFACGGLFYYFSADAQNAVFAVLGAVLLFLLPQVAYSYVAYRINARGKLVPADAALARRRSGSESANALLRGAQKCYFWLMSSTVEWAEDADGGFVARYGFGTCDAHFPGAPLLFQSASDFVSAAALNLVAGVNSACGSERCCLGTAAGAAFVAVFHSVLLLAVSILAHRGGGGSGGGDATSIGGVVVIEAQPRGVYLARIDVILAWTSSLLAAVSSILILVARATSGEGGGTLTAAAVVGDIGQGIGFAALIVNLVPLLEMIGLLCMKCARRVGCGAAREGEGEYVVSGRQRANRNGSSRSSGTTSSRHRSSSSSEAERERSGRSNSNSNVRRRSYSSSVNIGDFGDDRSSPLLVEELMEMRRDRHRQQERFQDRSGGGGRSSSNHNHNHTRYREGNSSPPLHRQSSSSSPAPSPSRRRGRHHDDDDEARYEYRQRGSPATPRSSHARRNPDLELLERRHNNNNRLPSSRGGGGGGSSHRWRDI